jgi:hypothetical protein
VTAEVEAPAPVVVAKRPVWLIPAIAGAAVLVLVLSTALVRRRSIKVQSSAALALSSASAQVAALADGGEVTAIARRVRSKDADEIRVEALEIALKDPATAAVILREWLNAPSQVAGAQAAHF